MLVLKHLGQKFLSYVRAAGKLNIDSTDFVTLLELEFFLAKSLEFFNKKWQKISFLTFITN